MDLATLITRSPVMSGRSPHARRGRPLAPAGGRPRAPHRRTGAVAHARRARRSLSGARPARPRSAASVRRDAGRHERCRAPAAVGVVPILGPVPPSTARPPKSPPRARPAFPRARADSHRGSASPPVSGFTPDVREPVDDADPAAGADAPSAPAASPGTEPDSGAGGAGSLPPPSSPPPPSPSPPPPSPAPSPPPPPAVIPPAPLPPLPPVLPPPHHLLLRHLPYLLHLPSAAASARATSTAGSDRGVLPPPGQLLEDPLETVTQTVEDLLGPILGKPKR